MSEEGNILPIVAYGDPVLKKVCEPIEENTEEVQQLIKDMFATMYNAPGVGLAAPQVGELVRLFVVDASSFAEEDDEETAHLVGFKKVFINAEMLKETGDEWPFEEGCLSIPKIREDVFRNEAIRIKYLDENFKEQEEEFDGLGARIIQHEYDHIEGILFTDHLNPLKKRQLKKGLANISRGEIDIDYKMRFPLQKVKR